ncbi:WAS WASL interacting protein, member 3 [Cichlidogyrus casuarinus]|uniref:WAS WASL interacting protein, member 3 n=1 Tax=Cichlidogyrus casuarinus TaxID=1844966 RepID=A0ABD2PNA7_9PLAT
MPGPPPPPPPPGPPPPGPKGAPQPGNMALLADIRKGTGLRKVPETEKRDRSAVQVVLPWHPSQLLFSLTFADGDSKSSNGGKSGGAGAQGGAGPAMGGGPMALGGLFAGGMPTLRPAGSKFVSLCSKDHSTSPAAPASKTGFKFLLAQTVCRGRSTTPRKASRKFLLHPL